MAQYRRSGDTNLFGSGWDNSGIEIPGAEGDAALLCCPGCTNHAQVKQRRVPVRELSHNRACTYSGATRPIEHGVYPSLRYLAVGVHPDSIVGGVPLRLGDLDAVLSQPEPKKVRVADLAITAPSTTMV